MSSSNTGNHHQKLNVLYIIMVNYINVKGHVGETEAVCLTVLGHYSWLMTAVVLQGVY